MIKELSKLQLNNGFKPLFNIGDTIVIFEEITEGKKNRIQRFEGIVLRSAGSGNNFAVTIRKLSYGIWVEKTFPLNSPLIKDLQVKSKGKVRRAYLSFLRTNIKLSSKLKRIKAPTNK